MNVTCISNVDCDKESSVCFVQQYSDKYVKFLKEPAVAV